MEYSAVLERLTDGQLLLQSGVGWKPGCVGQAKMAGDGSSPIGFTLTSGEPVVVSDAGNELNFKKTALLVEHGVISG